MQEAEGEEDDDDDYVPEKDKVNSTLYNLCVHVDNECEVCR